MKIQHKRSATAIGGKAKEPTAAQTERGELCINFSREDPALFIKDVDENIIRVGGDLSLYQKIEDVPSATIVCPPSEIDTLSPPDIRGEGSLWWNTEDGILYVWYEDADSSQWVITVPQGGGAGGDVPPGTTVGTAPPLNPEVGQLWWNSDDTENGGGRLYVYYNDGDSSQWVDTSVPGGKGSYLNESEAKGMFLSSTEDDTAAGKISFEAGIDVKGQSLFEATGPISNNRGIGQTFTNVPYGTLTFFKPTADPRTEQMSSYVRILHDDGGDKDLDTGKLACFYGQIRDTTPFRFTRDATVSCYDNILYADNIKAAAGSTVTVSGYRSNVPVSTETGVTNYNFYAAGNAPNYFNGNILCTKEVSVRSDSEDSGFPGVGNTNNGVRFQYAGVGGFSANFANATDATLHVNRNNYNGALVQYRKNGAAKGGIEIDDSRITLVEQYSDYRIKTNIQPLPSTVDKVKAINVVNFEYTDRAPGVVQEGFVAHELAEICPEAVVGTKDATEDIGTLTDWDGTELETKVTQPPAEELNYTEEVETDGVTQTVTRTRSWTKTGTRDLLQGVAQTKLIPILTKALQEVIAKNEDLEARLAALEGA